MVRFITRKEMQKLLELWFELDFGTVVENIKSVSPTLSLSKKIDGNEAYRDINIHDLEVKKIKLAILYVFDGKDLNCMILKNDATKRIAIIFDSIPDNFEINFTETLRNAGLSFKSGWIEDYHDLVYILQF